MWFVGSVILSIVPVEGHKTHITHRTTMIVTRALYCKCNIPGQVRPHYRLECVA